MNVAQVTYCYQPIIGGQEVYVHSLQDVLKNSGIHSKVYQPDLAPKKYADVVPVMRIPKVGGLIPFSDQYLFDFFLYLTKRGMLSKEDIIIAHYAFFALPVWDYEKKVIVLSHGIEWHLENQSLNDKIREKVVRQSADRFNLVVNDTHYLRFLGLNAEPGKGFFEEVFPNKWFIPNCVDTSAFQRNEGIEDIKKKNIILVPRQITVDRGIELAIEAFNLFCQDHEDYYLYIVGKVPRGEESYFKKCQSLIHAHGLENKVIFEGMIPNNQMSYYYSSAKLTLIPTLRREGTSLSALESMACGTATVSTNVAGLLDLPTVHTDPNPKDLAAKMNETLQNRQDIAAYQCEKVQKEFNLSNWSKAWLKVINSVKSRG